MTKRRDDANARLNEIFAEEPVYSIDEQGNPVDKFGNYILYDVDSKDLSDEDFTMPSRNVNLGRVSKELESLIPINGRDVIIKKNIFEKNKNEHTELSSAESRKVINAALNATDLLINDKPNNKPNYWILVNIGDKNALVNIDVNPSKPYIEVVGWRLVRNKSLEQIKNRANRDGGQVIMTQKGAAGLSALTTDSVSADKGSEVSGNKQENEKKLVGSKNKTQFSIVDQARDAEYAQAVKDGDMEKAQQMVDEAAKKNGYNKVSGFYIKDGINLKSDRTKYDIFAYEYGKHLREKYGEEENIDWRKEFASQFTSSNGVTGNAETLYGWELPIEERLDLYFRSGIKGMEMPKYVFAQRIGKIPEAGVSKNYRDNILERGVSVLGLYGNNKFNPKNSEIYKLFNDGKKYVVYGLLSEKRGSDNEYLLNRAQMVSDVFSAIKSGDAITYDDFGNVIPLSERFNDGNEDIRFSVSSEGEKKRSSGRGRAQSQTATSPEDLNQPGTVRLSRYAVAQEDLSAKLKHNYYTAKKKLKNFAEKGYKLVTGLNTIPEFVRGLATSIGLRKDPNNSNSFYSDFAIETANGKFRLSNHPANGDLMSRGDFDQRISVFIYDKKGEHKNDGTKPWKEFVFYPDTMSKEEIAKIEAENKGMKVNTASQDEITKSVALMLDDMLEGRTAQDRSRKAEIKEYNIEAEMTEKLASGNSTPTGTRYSVADEGGSGRRAVGGALAGMMRSAGIEVVTDKAEMQRVLNEYAKEIQKAAVEVADRRFKKELDEQINGSQKEGHVYDIGKPSAALLSTGFPNAPIQMSSRMLKTHSESPKHPFGLEEVSDIVSAMQRPVAIFTYGDQGKAQNVILDIAQGDKHFLVGVHFNKNVGTAEVSSIRSVFPKDSGEWLNWINQGKLLYADKEKIQNLIDQQRKTLADVEYLDLDSAAKVVENFENPTISADILQKMTVWHGSPYDFTSFDHANMGRGEGNQAHGYGAYVAVDKKSTGKYASLKRNFYSWTRSPEYQESEALIKERESIYSEFNKNKQKFKDGDEKMLRI